MSRFCQRLFERANPVCENELSIAANKQMNVFWHDDVSANGNVEIISSSFGELNECCVHRF